MRKIRHMRRRRTAKRTRRGRSRFYKRKTQRSRASLNRRRKRRTRRQRGGKHSSFSETKWLSKNVNLDDMGRANEVQTKKSGITKNKTSYFWQEKTDKILQRSDLGPNQENVVLYTRNNLTTPGTPTYSVLLAAGDGGECEIKIAKDDRLLAAAFRNWGTHHRVVNVVWVRHCHSCSNAAGEGPGALTPRGIQLKMREPLCTALGARQALHAGLYLNKLLPSGSNVQVKFYSSFLPRTFETAKLMAAAFTQKRPDAIDGGITRICNVSEETKPYEETAEKRRSEKLKGSQSTTTLSKSESHARYLNEKIKMGPTILPHGSPEDECVQGLIKGSNIKQLACDYTRFLREQLVAMSSSQSTNSPQRDNLFDSTGPEEEEEKADDTDVPDFYNVIVSHGGYIRHCVLQTTKEHPTNTQLFLVKYYLPENPGSPIYADISETIEMPGMSGSTSEIAKLTDDLNPALLSELTKEGGVVTDCHYKFHGTIEPTPSAIANNAPRALQNKMKTGAIAQTAPISMTPLG